MIVTAVLTVGRAFFAFIMVSDDKYEENNEKNKRISIQIGSVVTLLFFVTISLITIVVYWGTKELFLSTRNENMTYDLHKFKDLHMNEEITGIVTDDLNII